jgi:hypothetical protein
MNVRWLIVAGVGGVLFVGGGSAAAFGNEAGPANRGATYALIEGTAPIIDEVSLVGLRHLSQDKVQAQISMDGAGDSSARASQLFGEHFEIESLPAVTGWLAVLRT